MVLLIDVTIRVTVRRLVRAVIEIISRRRAGQRVFRVLLDVFSNLRFARESTNDPLAPPRGFLASKYQLRSLTLTFTRAANPEFLRRLQRYLRYTVVD